MSWRLRYAPHLGFRSLDKPLFLASVGSADPVAQIAFIASLGFAGVQDPWFAARPEAVQLQIASALSELGLAAGCIVINNDNIFCPDHTGKLLDRAYNPGECFYKLARWGFHE